MGETSIQWTDHSVNPIRARLRTKQADGHSTVRTGHYCEKVSPGCKHCYSSAMQRRFGMPQFQEQRRLDVEHFLDASKLEEVLRRRKPTKFFWCDMSDMFGVWVPDEWIAACFGVMAATPWHTHQVLTKRAERLREWFEWITPNEQDVLGDHLDEQLIRNDRGVWDRDRLMKHFPYDDWQWPLPNVWLGVSVEDQQCADERIPHLLATPAAVRFMSAEPLLGPIDFSDIRERRADGTERSKRALLAGDSLFGTDEFSRNRIDWVIVGSESGQGARPMAIEWAESLRDQCAAAGVAFFTKQIANERDRKGGKPEFWPAGPWPREFPEARP